VFAKFCFFDEKACEKNLARLQPKLWDFDGQIWFVSSLNCQQPKFDFVNSPQKILACQQSEISTIQIQRLKG
jgi:hypothetical protein